MMSETDSRGKAESSPLLGKNSKQRNNNAYAGPSAADVDEGTDMFDDYPFRDCCSRRVFIGSMLFVGLIFLKFCVSGRPVDTLSPVGPDDVIVPVRDIEDVVLPDRWAIHTLSLSVCVCVCVCVFACPSPSHTSRHVPNPLSMHIFTFIPLLFLPWYQIANPLSGI